MLARLLKNFYICTFRVLVDRQKQEVVTDGEGLGQEEGRLRPPTSDNKVPKLETAMGALSCGGPGMGCQRNQKKKHKVPQSLLHKEV